MLDDLKTRGVKFQSLTEAIDTTTPTGRAMWQMIGVLAELERSLISERTRAGVKEAQRRGVKFGRKPALAPEQIEHAKELRTRKKDPKTPQQIARILKCSPATVYRALAGW
jgi:DNA invertase Pin-like site-specific DNA recombinase